MTINVFSAIQVREERRRDERQILVLRVAVLEQAGRSTFCMLTNISRGGVQAKLYSPASIGAEIAIRVADELPVNGRIIWFDGRNAGISFDQDLKPNALLRVQQDLAAPRRRETPRVSVDALGILRTGGRTIAADVCDISSFGARVRTGCDLIAGARAILELPALPPVNAYVRWCDGMDFGLMFERPIPMQIVADWIAERPASSKPQHVIKGDEVFGNNDHRVA